jgi:hypothetical protein
MEIFKTLTRYALCTLLFFVVLTSCTKGDELKNRNKFKNYDVIEIDGCEYIEYGVSNGYLEITHKGDCKNKIHDCN